MEDAPDNLVECVECHEVFDYDSSGQSCEGGCLCDGCAEHDREYASTLVNYGQDGKTVIVFGDYLAYDEDGDWDAADALHAVLGKRKWHSTDAWRGYFDTPLQPGYVQLADGWGTGMPDETVQRKETLLDFGEWLVDNCYSAPGEGLYVLVEPTSNLFSQAVTVFCKEEDKQAIQDWLSAAGYGVDDLDYALS